MAFSLSCEISIFLVFYLALSPFPIYQNNLIVKPLTQNGFDEIAYGKNWIEGIFDDVCMKCYLNTARSRSVDVVEIGLGIPGIRSRTPEGKWRPRRLGSDDLGLLVCHNLNFLFSFTKICKYFFVFISRSDCSRFWQPIKSFTVFALNQNTSNPV